MLTILLPCKDQKKEFFLDAVHSIVQQTCPDWELLVITDPSSPAHLAEWTANFGDARIRLCPCPEPGFARALNFGMTRARGDFASILLSDDRYDKHAVAVLADYRRDFPQVDFFHSARRLIRADGSVCSPVMPSRPSFKREDFHKGSPVKHLLCWRISLALSIGGMDERFSLHGCDDYDFPWSMKDAGAQFHAVAECLYEYRIHHEHARLTTNVPLERQIATLRGIFAKHGESLELADHKIHKGADSYLISWFTDQVQEDRGQVVLLRCFRDAELDKKPAFVSSGLAARHFFPHRVYVLPKGGPDAFKIGRRLVASLQPSQMLEFVLYALPPLDSQFPAELYFDDDIQWHQQQFGLSGQIACANVIREPGALRCYVMVSDLVQRIQRAPQHRTQVDKIFGGWSRLLLHSILAHALDNGIETVYVASSALALRNTDPRRNPQAPLYERIYDRTPLEFGAEREGDWWKLSIPQIRNRIVPLTRRESVDAWPKTLCLLHDTERGLGHRTEDPAWAARSDRESDAALDQMLAIEARLGVRTTYSVVGMLIPELRSAIEAAGHTLAFHSYNHIQPGEPGAPPGADASEQLALCRKVDYRLKGYRPPQSKIHAGLSDANLVDFNFEWLASSKKSLGSESPRMENGLVKIPVHLDDYPLYCGTMTLEDWRRKVEELLDQRDFVVIGLHDCYAEFWLSEYERMLLKWQERASLLTLNEVAARFALGKSRWFLGAS